MTLFTLSTAGTFYKKDQAKKLEKLGFKFKEVVTEYIAFKGEDLSIESDRVEIKIDTLDELLAFAKEYGGLIINAHGPSIEIYDGYRE